MRFGDLRHYCGISVMLGGVQYDVNLHGAVQCSCGHLTRGEERQRARDVVKSFLQVIVRSYPSYCSQHGSSLR